VKEIPICENVVRLKRCSCAEVAGENPDCELHGVSVQSWAQMSDDDCMMEPDIDSFTVRRKSQEAAAIIRDLVTALGACVAVAERPLKNAMNLNGKSPYDLAMAALSRAQVQP
jgi:glutamine synthetase